MDSCMRQRRLTNWAHGFGPITRPNDTLISHSIHPYKTLVRHGIASAPNRTVKTLHNRLGSEECFDRDPRKRNRDTGTRDFPNPWINFINSKLWEGSFRNGWDILWMRGGKLRPDLHVYSVEEFVSSLQNIVFGIGKKVCTEILTKATMHEKRGFFELSIVWRHWFFYNFIPVQVLWTEGKKQGKHSTRISFSF